MFLTLADPSSAFPPCLIQCLGHWREQIFDDPAFACLDLGLDGEADAMTQHCARFANQLRGRFNLPVVEVDERLSSLAAEQLLVASGQRDWRRRKDRLDAVAACVILQTYLDGLPHEAQI